MNVSKGFPEVLENSFLYGLEAEYGTDPDGFGIQNLFSFYESDRPQFTIEEKLTEPSLSLMNVSHWDGLDAETEKLFQYLPKKTIREVGKNYTHEIATEVLPNLQSSEKLIDLMDQKIGHASYQGMISIPRDVIFNYDAAEIEGFVFLTGELALLSALKNPGLTHPLLQRFNRPYMAEKGAFNRMTSFKQEMKSYFSGGNFSSALGAKEISNPKYAFGIAPRFDLSSEDPGKRFFFEVRGCKENKDCIKAMLGQITDVFQNQIHGFKKFRSFYTLMSMKSASHSLPYRMSKVWENLTEEEQQGIQKQLKKRFTVETVSEDVVLPEQEAQGVDRNFLYPLKAWSEIAESLGLSAANIEKLEQAQTHYLGSLKQALLKSKVEDMMVILTPALSRFAEESTLLAQLEAEWKQITGKVWDVQYGF